jgi:putative transposase
VAHPFYLRMRVPHPFAFFAKGWEALHSDFTMPQGLIRFQQARTYHFLTFSCYGRRPLLGAEAAYACFERQLEAVRQRYRLVVAGYVLMPEHVHLLVGEPGTATLSVAIQVLKQQTSRRLSKRGETFWQRRYYDFNVWSEEKTREKLRYIHRNPVRRGLVAEPVDWPWSSFRHYATGAAGVIEIESEWTARRREREVALG